jgi:hypothetical protein
MIKDVKLCDEGTLVQMLCFCTLSIVLSLSKKPSCLFFKTQGCGNWILSLSSGKTYSVWAQSIELVPVSGPEMHMRRDLLSHGVTMASIVNIKRDRRISFLYLQLNLK